jgi:hypothetical protein
VTRSNFARQEIYGLREIFLEFRMLLRLTEARSPGAFDPPSVLAHVPPQFGTFATRPETSPRLVS